MLGKHTGTIKTKNKLADNIQILKSQIEKTAFVKL